MLKNVHFLLITKLNYEEFSNEIKKKLFLQHNISLKVQKTREKL